MDKVTEYSIIESDAHAELVEAVNEALREGWQPHGGLVIWYEPSSSMGSMPPGGGGGGGGGTSPIVHYAQALVKYGP